MHNVSNALHIIFVDPFISIWSPTRVHTQGNKPATGLAKCEYIAKVSLKIIGKTITLGAVGIAAALTLKAISGTKLGGLLGTTAFVATFNSCPPALLVTAGIIVVIATGLLTSYLIEKYIP